MKIIGITGGIGTGKSEVLKYASAVDGAFVAEADKIAHDLMEPGGACFERIVSLFGSSVLAEDGSLDRNVLGAIVMNDKDKLRKLNSIVHPEVKEYVRSDIEVKWAEGYRFYILEAALLIQDGYRFICDEIWFIRSTEEVRVERLIKARCYTEEKAYSFIQIQTDDSFYIEGSDRVIDNDETPEKLHEKLSKLFDEISVIC